MSIGEKNSLLFRAVTTGSVSDMSTTLAKGASINALGSDGDTPLLLAIRRGQMEAALFLISRGASRDVRDKLGYTALHLAVSNASSDVVKAILDKGARLDSTARNGDSPLHTAISFRRTDVVDLLISYGADPNLPDKLGNAPLHLAIITGNHEIVKVLVAKGADVNVKSPLDDTPLHLSVYLSDADTTKFLRDNGANEDILNVFGLRPSEMRALPAVEARSAEAARLLSRNGEWDDPPKARKLYEALKREPPKILINSMVVQIIRDSKLRLKLLLLAIKLGISGTEEKLSPILTIYGDRHMAEDYLNSGSKVLADGASDWAQKHGYKIMRFPGSNRATWGRF